MQRHRPCRGGGAAAARALQPARTPRGSPASSLLRRRCRRRRRPPCDRAGTTCRRTRAAARRGRVADDLGLADRQALGVARLVEEDRQLLVADARAGAEPAAPLLDDDAAFLVDFLRIERQPAGEVGQRRQPLRDDLRPCRSAGRACRPFRRSSCTRSRAGPSRAPIDSKYETSSPGLKCALPLNAMCSMRCASPCWSSASSSEPALTASRSDTRLAGGAFWRMKNCRPFGSVPVRTAASNGMAVLKVERWRRRRRLLRAERYRGEQPGQREHGREFRR